MGVGPEHKFQKKVIKALKTLPNTYYFVKEAASIRGIPDLILVINGRFVALELKRDLKSMRATTGRIVLQRHNIDKINKAGGFGCIVCPETFDEVFAYLKSIST